MMHTYVTFHTARFRGTDPVRDGTEVERYGQDCAGWMAEQLSTFRAVEVLGEPVQSLWGWELPLRVPPATERVMLQIGVAAEDPPEWRIYIVANRPKLWGLLESPDREVESLVARALHPALASAGDIHDIRWHESSAFLQGVSRGTSSPKAV